MTFSKIDTCLADWKESSLAFRGGNYTCKCCFLNGTRSFAIAQDDEASVMLTGVNYLVIFGQNSRMEMYLFQSGEALQFPHTVPASFRENDRVSCNAISMNNAADQPKIGAAFFPGLPLSGL